MTHGDLRKLPAAQEERRRQVIGLRQAGLTSGAIAAPLGLTQTGVFDIGKRYAERGAAGLKTGPRGPEPGGKMRAPNPPRSLAPTPPPVAQPAVPRRGNSTASSSGWSRGRGD